MKSLASWMFLENFQMLIAVIGGAEWVPAGPAGLLWWLISSAIGMALTKAMPIADEINHHNSPAGPAGTHSAPPITAISIWKFSRNIQLARDFIKFLFQKDNYNAWI